MSLYERPSTSSGYYRRALSVPSFSSNYRIHTPSILEDEQVQSRSCTPIHKIPSKEKTPKPKSQHLLKGGADNCQQPLWKKQNYEIQISPSKYLTQEPRASTRTQVFHTNGTENSSQRASQNTPKPSPEPQNELEKVMTLHERISQLQNNITLNGSKYFKTLFEQINENAAMKNKYTPIPKLTKELSSNKNQTNMFIPRSTYKSVLENATHIYEKYKKSNETKNSQSNLPQFLPPSIQEEKFSQQKKNSLYHEKDYEQQKVRTMELFERAKSRTKFCPTNETYGKDPKRYLSANLSTDHYISRPSVHDNVIYCPTIPSAPIGEVTTIPLTGLRRRYTPREMKIAKSIFKNIKEAKREHGDKHCGYGKPRIERPFILGN